MQKHENGDDYFIDEWQNIFVAVKYIICMLIRINLESSTVMRKWMYQIQQITYNIHSVHGVHCTYKWQVSDSTETGLNARYE